MQRAGTGLWFATLRSGQTQSAGTVEGTRQPHTRCSPAQRQEPPQRNFRRVGHHCTAQHLPHRTSFGTLRSLCSHFPHLAGWNVPVRQHRCFLSLPAAQDPWSLSPAVHNQLRKLRSKTLQKRVVPASAPIPGAGDIARRTGSAPPRPSSAETLLLPALCNIPPHARHCHS